MLKILSAAQIRDIDAYTITNEPIASIDLMERAAKVCYAWIKPRVRKKNRVHVFCGPGNNGGDGLAIARMLAGTGNSVSVYKVRISDHVSPDFAANAKRLNAIRKLSVYDVESRDQLPEIGKDDVVIDALFGNGLSKPVTGLAAAVITHINAAEALVIAVDLPSGLYGDGADTELAHPVIRADYTLTFQFPKLCLLFAHFEAYVGQWQVLDIGLHPEAIASASSHNFIIQNNDVQAIIKPRLKFSHKGNYGNALLIGGSKGKMGAAVLASRACLRAGVGKLTASIPACGYDIYQTTVPEAMCFADNETDYVSSPPAIELFNAIAMGPGSGVYKQTSNVLKVLIQQSKFPLLLDADAINILADNRTWCDFLPPHSIITPHAGEFDRLAGKSANDVERFHKAKEFASRFQLIIVLKGAHTSVISPAGYCWFNTTGNPGMATAGSGDVLTGILLSFLAQGYSPIDSAIAAVHLHGLAGDLAARRKGYEGLIAGDIVEMLPNAMRFIQSK